MPADMLEDPWMPPRNRDVANPNPMNKSFLLPIALAGLAARADVLLYEPFSYPDGQLSTGSAGLWVNHSGSTPLNVVGGAALIDQADAASGKEDLNRLLSQTFDPSVDNSSVLYAGFSVNFSAPPAAGTAGSYFGHFKSSAGSEFYARIGANSEGAPADRFYLGIGNEAWSSAASIEHPLELQVGVTYEVVVRLDLGTDLATLWVNPSDESSPNVSGADTIGYAVGEINAFALRQGTTGAGGPGTLLVDELKVGTSFAEVRVVPEPSTWALLGTGAVALAALARRRR